MRLIVGLVVASFWFTAQPADARPSRAKHTASAKKPKVNSHKKQAAKAEEPAPAPDVQPKAPAPPPRVERAPVTQVVDSEEPEVRKRK